MATSHLLSSINTHVLSITPSTTTNYFIENNNLQEQQILPSDVKNLIESSLTAIGLDHVDDNDFDKVASTEQNNNDLPIDDNIDKFEYTTTNNDTSSTSQITRPVNIPNSLSNDYFSHSLSTKSPFDTLNQLFDKTLESVC